MAECSVGVVHLQRRVYRALSSMICMCRDELKQISPKAWVLCSTVVICNGFGQSTADSINNSMAKGWCMEVHGGLVVQLKHETARGNPPVLKTEPAAYHGLASLRWPPESR